MNERKHTRQRTRHRGGGANAQSANAKGANAHSANAHSANAKGAFTLIEMLAVLAVIGILFGVAVVGFNHIGRNSRLRTGGRLVGQQLDLARQLAMAQRRMYGVQFAPHPEPERDRLRVYYKDTKTNDRITVGKWIELPPGIEFGAPPPPYDTDMPPDQEGIQFKPTGSTVNGTLSFKIHDKDSGTYREVNVYQVTGHSTVKVP